MSKLKLFLSTATDDFGSAIREFLRTELTSSAVGVEIQETLKSVGGTTGDTLDTYVRAADVVVHVIGTRSGYPLPQSAIDAVRARNPDLKDKLPWLDELLGGGGRAPAISYTQLEAYLAVLHGKQLFCYVPKDVAEGEWPGDDEQQRGHLARMRKLNRHPTVFEDRNRLLARIAIETSPVFGAKGIKRLTAVDTTRMPTTFATRLFGREKEMALLNGAWDSAAEPATKCNVLVLDAMGGTGKTALINHFVHGLGAEGWRGAAAVFVWSFYSQGTDDKRQASADAFFSAALAWFGYSGPIPPSQHDKGVRLAELVKAQRTLLVLDGLEPLQYGPSRRSGGSGDAGITGGLKDHGLRALLRQLSLDNPGLVLVTTRLRVPDLNGQPEPAVVTRKLAPIPTADGVELVFRNIYKIPNCRQIRFCARHEEHQGLPIRQPR